MINVNIMLSVIILIIAINLLPKLKGKNKYFNKYPISILQITLYRKS